MNIVSAVINTVIFIVTAIITLLFFRQDERWSLRRGLRAFRYFTVLSNVLCALAALAMAICQARGTVPACVVTAKYLGTVSVTVTLLTVFLFLGPSTGGYRQLLSGADLYMHLIGPVLAIVSFCFLEKREMSLGTALLGVLPVLLYGAVYLYKVVCVAEDKCWEDFYGFNKGGKWPAAFAAMIVGTLAVCLLFWRL